MVPYYLFVARDTGAQHYFKIPLAEALDIYSRAYRQVSGLARSARGPVMSASPGKVLVDGMTRSAGEEVFVLKFIQGRDPGWVGQTFFARFDPAAAWLDDLEPAHGRSEFFFEPRFREIKAHLEARDSRRRRHAPWSQRHPAPPQRPPIPRVPHS
jgi:hypothetical protein